MKQSISNYLLAFCLIFSIVFISIRFWSLNVSHYDYESKKTQAGQTLNISHQDISKVNQQIINYLNDDFNELQVCVAIDQKTVPFFNSQEIEHMRDVKCLFGNFNHLGLFVLILGSLIFVIKLFSKAKFKYFFNSFKRVLILLSAIVLAIIFLAVIDFDSFWYNLHFIFFDNMNWILSPDNSRLIILMNPIFFKDMLILISFSIIILIGLFYFLIRFFDRKEKLK